MNRFTLIDTVARQAMRRTEDGGLTDRRRALQLLASGAALALSACQKPREQILPYVNTPDGETPGAPRHYATALTLGGYARGATAVAIDGRPIKIDGNAAHPASLGATDVFAEAAILDLYDPSRSKTARGPDGPAAWDTFGETLRMRVASANEAGAGLSLLTPRLTSPTLLRQIEGLKRLYPRMAWSRYEPAHDDNDRQGARLALGRPLEVRPRFADADVVLCLDADPTGPGPDQITYARALTARRRPETARGMSRLYVAEGSLSQTGALADHRAATDADGLHAIALALAKRLGADVPVAAISPKLRAFSDAVGADLVAHKSRALVLVGREQPAELHALAHWINAKLEAPVDQRPLVDPHPDDHATSLQTLMQAMQSGAVTTLIVMDANPAYDVPGFAAAMRHVPFTAHLGAYQDETAAIAHWHAPISHALESWSDVRAADGTVSIVQPVIRPLYDTRPAATLLALLSGDIDTKPRDLVRQTWTQLDEDAWKAALAQGVVANSASAPIPAITPKLITPPPSPPGLTLSLRPDSCLWDGRYATNAWLQECPEPLTKEVWGRAARMSSADARRLGLKTGDRIRLSAGAKHLDVAVIVTPGQAAGVLTLPLGGGRTAAGPIGSNLGANPAALRGDALAWRIPGVRVEKLSGGAEILETQTAVQLGGDTGRLARVIALKDAKRRPADPPPPSLFPEAARGDHAWAMAIDAQACIGCSACVVACQAENNIPVVGPEEIKAGRDLHWLRIDRYDLGDEDDPQPGFLPIPCMQCEHAPCEPVCPVEASVHDHEGLNNQVYNRCVGTRFCQANCPYKVRRFNFRDYQAEHVYADLDVTALKAQRNPEVSVRARGVMEKCTYCTQRIAAARSDSERTGQPIADGALKTACQSACPTQAISFGDLNDPKSRVNALRAEPRHYALLEELGTRPRTTYLARVRNPNPALETKA